MQKKAVLFDLDGVLVTTDDCHYRAWKQMADEEQIPFTRADNERLRGVSRMASLEIILEKAVKTYSAEEKIALAERKNRYYVQLIRTLTETAILPGAKETVIRLREANVLTAVASSSKNARLILERVGLLELFDAIADGTQITKSKPNPEVFLKAAELLHKKPEDCIAVEDADAGIAAAKNAGMFAVAVGNAKGGDLHCGGLDDVDLLELAMGAGMEFHNEYTVEK